jgi:hypothetical protein
MDRLVMRAAGSGPGYQGIPTVGRCSIAIKVRHEPMSPVAGLPNDEEKVILESVEKGRQLYPASQ